MTGTGGARVPGAGAPPAARGPRVDRLPLLTAAATLLALAGVLRLGALRTVVHDCVDLDGPLALLGVRLTLLQDASDCPTGVALSPGTAHGAVLALGLVLPVVALHAALGALGLGLTALLLRTNRTVRSVLGAVAPTLPRPVRVRPAGAARSVPAWCADARRPAVLAHALHPHRGPPAALA